MQLDLTAASCVKAYVSDLKNWMTVNGKKMRILPLAYAAADSSYGTEITNADDYHVLKVQGLLCGDSMKDGMMQKSIDIYLINEYRWCPDSTFTEAYQRYINMAKGIPIVVAFGEYGCKTDSSTVRDWGMVPYLYQEPSKTEDFTEVWSGGLAYSYGEAKLGTDSLFPMFTGTVGSPDEFRGMHNVRGWLTECVSMRYARRLDGHPVDGQLGVHDGLHEPQVDVEQVHGLLGPCRVDG
jgi:hypothetical protein